MEEHMKERTAAKRRFSRRVKIFREAHRKGKRSKALRQIYEEVCESFKLVDETNETLIGSLKESESSDEYEQFIMELELVKHELYDMLLDRSENVKGPTLAIKKLEPPKFCGSIRAFPTFMKDFERLVVTRQGRDPYVLRNSLEGEPLKLVEDINDYECMWARLKETYGNPGKMIDCILGDIKATKPVLEGDSKKLISMINTVEKVWLDIENLGQLQELENTTVLAYVERLLPSSLRREWAMKVQTLTSNRFKNLVMFLTERRKALEYLQDESRIVPAKGSIHLLEKDSTMESELAEAIRQLAIGQENFQRQLLEGLANASFIKEKTYKAGKGRNGFPQQRPEMKWCSVHESNTHDLKDCSTFKHWANDTKFDYLKHKRICYTCLNEGHLAKNCDQRFPCQQMINGEQCARYHHNSIHPLFTNESRKPIIEGNNSHMSRNGVMLMTGYVNSGNHIIPTLYDAGSNLSLITTRMARKLGLVGTPISLNITKVGAQTENLESYIYKVPLRDRWGREILVDMCGITEITAVPNKVDINTVAQMFGIQKELIQRPSGRIELLIGSDYCTLLPKVIKTIHNVQLMENDFGFCLRGNLDDNVMQNDNFNVQINHVTFYRPEEWLVTTRPNPHKVLEEFFSTENLGTQCTPRCGGCKCGHCSLTGELTLKEERELKLIEEGLHYDKSKNCWVSGYPWVTDPYKLPNNISMAIARLKSTERRLKRMGTDYCSKYQEQINDMLERGVAQKLTKQEIENYDGPVFYLPHHEVHKPESQSTPLRIVFNAAASFHGIALNDCLAKGPDVLNNLLGILIRFRQNQVGLVGDIKKMYHSVKISEFDGHTHRFLWRDLNERKQPEHYMLKAVTFGDKPGGAIAMVALRKTAQMNNDYPSATKMIIEDSYVDDILGSVDSMEAAVERMQQVEEVLKGGGFMMKQWIVSGENYQHNEKMLDTSHERVLGLDWKTREDLFSFKIKLNFSKKTRQGRSGPNIVSDELNTALPSLLTKRIILSQIATLYDPLGFITPFTLKAKLLIREIVMDVNGSQPKGWDEPVGEIIYDKAKSLFKEMFLLEQFKIKRCVKPPSFVGNPDLVIFSDGSTKAYGAVAYIRWEVEDGSFSSHLLCSKNRIAPIRQISVPRLELCGAVIGSRLRSVIEKEIKFQFKRIIHITDSSIVRSQIQKDSFRFNTFVANRVAEIQSRTKPNEWYWIPSEYNIADLTTRECNPLDLGPDSLWQMGPNFLKLNFDDWPVKQGFEEELPDVVCVKSSINLQESKAIQPVIDIGRVSGYKKLLSITARVLRVAKERSLRVIGEEPTTEELQEAEMFWIKQVQTYIPSDWETSYRRLGPKLNEDKLVVVGTRISKWLKDNWNCNEFILLIAEHPFTKLYIQHLHQKDHGGVEACLAKMQLKFWVPGARRIIKKVKQQCIVCRKIDKKYASQCMGELPKERLEPSPPFYNTSLDLFGPYLICDTVKRRVMRKTYGVIFNCMATRAVYIDLAEGYDTENFLKVFKRFVSIRGFPRKVFSDKGTQLVAANKELRDMVSKWNLKDIFSFGRFEGLSWQFNKSSGAPWENGCSEALIRLVKRSMGRIIGNSVMTYADLQTIMFDIANLLNERPIGYISGSDIDNGTALRPNDLLLGRSTITAPFGVWDEISTLSKRIAFKNQIIDAFWRKWNRDYFPSLIVRQKWHVDVRNIQPGDIVLVNDLNVMKGEWKFAQVVKPIESKDGKVRDVLLRYKTAGAVRKYTGQPDVNVIRSVHKLVVLLPVEEQ